MDAKKIGGGLVALVIGYVLLKFVFAIAASLLTWVVIGAGLTAGGVVVTKLLNNNQQ
tara:strand:- start:432 stop:602 length:171 start_codon:yes stop_codon:yes gene_type:complete